MTKRIYKQGVVVVVLRGRQAGRKAVVLRVYDEGSGTRKFPHAVVVGLEKAPRKVTRAMYESDKARVTRRISVRPFIKYVNLQHLMPTRYTLDVSGKLNTAIDDDTLADAENAAKLKRAAKQLLDQRFLNLDKGTSERKKNGAKYFFSRLKF